MSGEIAHMLCLDPPAQLLAQFMGSTLDDRVMGDPHDGALHPIKRYRNLRRLVQELVEFFLKFGRCPIHGLTPFLPRFHPHKEPRNRNLPQNTRVLLLTISAPCLNQQKLASTLAVGNDCFGLEPKPVLC
jgi:hypothetical protein